MMNKRVLSIILVLSTVISACVFAMPAHAAIGIAHEAEVSKLSAFGILTGYPDANYKASDTVSAGDFTAAAYKLLGVDGDHTAAMAKKFGFGADDKTITLQNALAVLFSILNYDYEADANGGYPNGYYKMAAGYKVLTGTGLAMTDNLTKDAMAVILYNALELDTVAVRYETGGTTVEHSDESVMDALGIYQGYGTVTGTRYASLNGCRKSGGNRIVIDDKNSYFLGKTYADTLLGYAVEFYYNEDDELLWIDKRTNMSIAKIAEIDIISLNASEIHYYNESGRKKSYSFDNATFIYNGKNVPSPDFERFLPLSGYVTVVDYDNDGKVEVVICEAYEYYLVSGTDATGKIISDYETGKSVSLNADDYASVRIIKNGAPVPFSAIAEHDIVAVMKSDETDGVISAVVSPHKPVSGAVEILSDRDIQIDGNTYTVSTAYAGSALSVGKSGTFYLDMNGNVIRYVKGKTEVSKYAYLIAAQLRSQFDNCYLYMLTAGNAIEERKTASKIRYNGKSVSPDELYERLSGSEKADGQLICYALNSAGEINQVETANKDNLYSGNDEPGEEFSLYFQGHGRYRKNNLSFNSKYLIDADTPIFIVPSSREKSDYEVRYAASLTNGTSYYISVYDIDEYMTAGAVVLHEIASDPEMLKSKRSILVERTFVSVNGDGEQIVGVHGYQQGSKVTLKTKDKDAVKDSEGRYYSIGGIAGYTELSKGDVIQASLDVHGNLLAFRTLYKADEDKKNLVIASNETPNEYEEGGNVNEFADLFVLHGKVVSRSSNVLVVESDTKRAHKITTGISVYIVGGRGIEKVTASDICVNDEVYLHTYQGNVQEVVVYR